MSKNIQGFSPGVGISVIALRLLLGVEVRNSRCIFGSLAFELIKDKSRSYAAFRQLCSAILSGVHNLVSLSFIKWMTVNQIQASNCFSLQVYFSVNI